jgi:hypothetical protein
MSKGMRFAILIENFTDLDHDVLWDRRLVAPGASRVQLRWRRHHSRNAEACVHCS